MLTGRPEDSEVGAIVQRLGSADSLEVSTHAIVVGRFGPPGS